MLNSTPAFYNLKCCAEANCGFASGDDVCNCEIRSGCSAGLNLCGSIVRDSINVSHDVSSIHVGHFARCNDSRISRVMRIIIPRTVTYIEKRAFCTIASSAAKEYPIRFQTVVFEQSSKLTFMYVTDYGVTVPRICSCSSYTSFVLRPGGEPRAALSSVLVHRRLCCRCGRLRFALNLTRSKRTQRRVHFCRTKSSPEHRTTTVSCLHQRRGIRWL